MIKLDIRKALNPDFTVKDRNVALVICQSLADMLRNNRTVRTLVEREDVVVEIAPPYDELELGVLFITLAHALGMGMSANGVVIAKAMAAASRRASGKGKLAPKRNLRAKRTKAQSHGLHQEPMPREARSPSRSPKRRRAR